MKNKLPSPERFEAHERQILEALERPVPNMDQARQDKEGYQDMPIDETSSLFGEPTVNLDSYGRIAGQSYYSRSNKGGGDALSWVDPNVHVRKTIAERLCALNQMLQLPVITEFFGGEVELFIQDGLRPLSLQKLLYEDFFPRLIRTQYPGIKDQDFNKKLLELVSPPSMDLLRPSPHSTGGAFDVTLRYVQDDPYFVKTANPIEFGHISGDVTETVHLDYYENHQPIDQKQVIGQRNRRALYAIMTGAAFNWPTDFVNNPTEWWHWSFGDQMWAKLRQEPAAFYSSVQ